MMTAQPNKMKKGKKLTQAARADKYDLYQKSVQSPEFESDFMATVFKKVYKRDATILREDFCGTHAVCCEWLKKGKADRQAWGVDLDPEPLAWGKTHNQDKLSEGQKERLHLVEDNVLTAQAPTADVIAAQNFSFWIFKTRDDLRTYFSKVFRNLNNEGVLVLDMMGGAEAITDDSEEETEHDGFTYVWDQDYFDPVTHDCTFNIHFRFDDGSEIKNAFSYHWRLWTLPEVQEILKEAGFNKVEVYWEGADEDGEGNAIKWLNTANATLVGFPTLWPRNKNVFGPV